MHKYTVILKDYNNKPEMIQKVEQIYFVYLLAAKILCENYKYYKSSLALQLIVSVMRVFPRNK